MKNLESSNNRKTKKSIFSNQFFVLVVLIVVSLVFFAFVTPNYSFVKISNLNNILTDAVIPAIFAFGMAMIIACSGFDLSLGHLASMVALIVAYLMNPGIKCNPVLAILVGLVAAALVGAANGLIVSRSGISSFIVTLGMQFFIIGYRQTITNGSSVYISNEGFKWLAKSDLGVSNLLIILVIVGFLCYLLMEKSTLGRKIQFIGENVEASKFMGINIYNITLYTFVFGAILAGIGGILFAARAGAVQINSVDSKLLDAITIAVFAKVLFSRYNTLGIILVAILISMISTGMNMLGVQTGWIDFMKGFVVLVSILLSFLLNSPVIKKSINPRKGVKDGCKEAV